MRAVAERVVVEEKPEADVPVAGAYGRDVGARRAIRDAQRSPVDDDLHVSGTRPARNEPDARLEARWLRILEARLLRERGRGKSDRQRGDRGNDTGMHG